METILRQHWPVRVRPVRDLKAPLFADVSILVLTIVMVATLVLAVNFAPEAGWGMTALGLGLVGVAAVVGFFAEIDLRFVAFYLITSLIAIVAIAAVGLGLAPQRLLVVGRSAAVRLSLP